MPASDAFSFYHACTGNSLTIGNVLVTWDATYRTGLRDNNCGLRNFQRAASTGHAHSTLSETGFENQGPVVRTPVTTNPGLNFNPAFFFLLSKALSRVIFSILFRVSSHQIVGKKSKTEFEF